VFDKKLYVLLNLIIHYIEDILNSSLKIILVQFQYYSLIGFVLFIYLLIAFFRTCRDGAIIAI
jgi:hypothetical protein